MHPVFIVMPLLALAIAALSGWIAGRRSAFKAAGRYCRKAEATWKEQAEDAEDDFTWYRRWGKESAARHLAELFEHLG